MDRVADIDLTALTAARRYLPSPVQWGDAVFYFLLVDRFSDGNETGYLGPEGAPVTSGRTLPYQAGADNGSAIRTEAEAASWREAGIRWCGGTINGLTSKLPYLRRLGITAVSISPVLKQVAFQNTYHGYGVQNFLAVDPHIGTLQDLQRLVAEAHENGIYVIVDIILNHAGNVFRYSPDRYLTVDNATGYSRLEPRWDGRTYDVEGFNDSKGSPCIPFTVADPEAVPGLCRDSAVWPAEFQNPSYFNRKGYIYNWEYPPEFMEGDFDDMKGLYHGFGDASRYQPSPALVDLCKIYQYWIAVADIDGYRIDTVKHIDVGATKYFVSEIKRFASRLGKRNFFLAGEIAGGTERALDIVAQTGLDAVIGLEHVMSKLEGVLKGRSNPEVYFDVFSTTSDEVAFGNRVMVAFDDHDRVCQGGGYKERFCSSEGGDRLILAAVGLNATTLGIPCIYYGTEQGFDGGGGGHIPDRYLRECMFGGSFGAFRSRDRHFFTEDHRLYQEISAILNLRKEMVTLRRGRQYLREISGDGITFGPPRGAAGKIRSVLAWSRILDSEELLLAINTDPYQPHQAWVVVDHHLHEAGSRLTCIYSTTPETPGVLLTVEHKGENRDIAAVHVEVPPGGFVVLQ